MGEEGGKRTQPVIYPEVRNAVPNQEAHPSVLGTDEIESKTYDEESNISEQNVFRLVWFVKGTL